MLPLLHTLLFLSLSQLLKMGFIDKANFDEEDKHLYDRERRENSVIKEKQGMYLLV